MLTNQRPAPWDGERAAVVGTELWLTAGVVPPSKSLFSYLARRSDTPRSIRPDARCGRVLNEKVPTGNHASGFFSIPIERQDRQST